ncbi:MAG: LysM peptidoglycan-binding domain-containing protein [Candidatus Edwardsbacteria bacterium]|jgi:LysM repeat protein|nr:LysM peptidoglycan-binding domain-containing protein [Candidatus Edwardsbacteria bacterium]
MRRSLVILSLLALAAAALAAGTVHVVRRGETLSAISKRYHVPIADILAANGLSRSAVIKAGQKLKIPSRTAAAKPAAAAPAPKPEPIVSAAPGPAMDTIMPEIALDSTPAPAPASTPAPRRPGRMSTKTKFFILFVFQTIVSALLAYVIARWVASQGGGYKRGS